MALDWCIEFHHSLTVGYSSRDSPTRKTATRAMVEMVLLLSFLMCVFAGGLSLVLSDACDGTGGEGDSPPA